MNYLHVHDWGNNILKLPRRLNLSSIFTKIAIIVISTKSHVTYLQWNKLFFQFWEICMIRICLRSTKRQVHTLCVHQINQDIFLQM